MSTEKKPSLHLSILQPPASHFTVAFGKDGQASFQLDCNRGSGTYQASPSSDGVSGSLTFGPIAATLMMCPQPSLDQTVSPALPHVRGYLYKEIALRLGISAKTVEAHVSAVLRKLQLSNRHELSRWAAERRLVE